MISVSKQLSVFALSWSLCCVVALNNRPIIGIVSEKLYSSPQSYIAASYVKYIEAAGGRVVPILSNYSDENIEKLFNSINGVLFPGGGVYLNSSGYGRIGQKVYELAKQANDKKDFFPLWGTCLGFELLAYLEAGMGTSVLSKVDGKNLSLPLDLAQDATDSRLFKNVPKDLLSQLSTLPITFNSHSYGVTTATFYNSNLKPFYDVLSTNKDRNGVEFVSTMEAFMYPFYAVQWHPEKNMFEWTTHEDIPHSLPAVEAAQAMADFFVQEARKSDHSFPTPAEETAALIYNYSPVYTGAGGRSSFTQTYVFPDPA